LIITIPQTTTNKPVTSIEGKIAEVCDKKKYMAQNFLQTGKTSTKACRLDRHTLGRILNM